MREYDKIGHELHAPMNALNAHSLSLQRPFKISGSHYPKILSAGWRGTSTTALTRVKAKPCGAFFLPAYTLSSLQPNTEGFFFAKIPITLHGTSRSPAPPLAAALHRSPTIARRPHSLHLWLLCRHPRGHLQGLLLSFRARSASGNFTPFPIHLPNIATDFRFRFSFLILWSELLFRSWS